MASLGDREQGEEEPAAKPYEPPAILWEEPYTPVVLCGGCNFEQGNPGCSIPYN